MNITSELLSGYPVFLSARFNPQNKVREKINIELFPWLSNLLHGDMVAHEAIAECVTDVLTTFWRLLWSVTEQMHSNMEHYLTLDMPQANQIDLEYDT